MTDDLERRPALHSYYCDCEWCWLGVTRNPIKPLNWWQRLLNRARQALQEGSRHE